MADDAAKAAFLKQNEKPRVTEEPDYMADFIASFIKDHDNAVVDDNDNIFKMPMTAFDNELADVTAEAGVDNLFESYEIVMGGGKPAAKKKKPAGSGKGKRKMITDSNVRGYLARYRGKEFKRRYSFANRNRCMILTRMAHKLRYLQKKHGLQMAIMFRDILPPRSADGTTSSEWEMLDPNVVNERGRRHRGNTAEEQSLVCKSTLARAGGMFEDAFPDFYKVTEELQSSVYTSKKTESQKQ